MRAALGARRSRLLRQLVVEYLVLALCGGVIGAGIAFGAVRMLTNASGVSIPMLSAVSIDGAALAFALGITLLAALLTGIVPALNITRRCEADALNDTSRGSTEGKRSTAVREVLVVGEVALTCVLLVAMGLLLRSFVNVLAVEPGFQPDGALLWEAGTNRPFETSEARHAFYQNLIDRVREIPGIDGAGLTDTPPLARNRSWTIAVPGVVYEEGQAPVAFPRIVDSEYVKVMQIPLRAGRHFTAGDAANSTRVMIVNETAARVLYPGQDAVGREVQLFGTAWRIIGVVGDVRHQSLEEGSGLEIYLPMGQLDMGNATLVVRSRAASQAIVPAVRATLRGIDATLPTDDYQTLDAIIGRATSPRRFIIILLGAFAAAALLLAALGIYAVQSYSVSQRIPEIGIRMALGETAVEIRRRIVARTVLVTGIGVSIGAGLAFVTSRLLRSLLFGVQPSDVPTYAGIALLLILIGAAGGWLPARRASSTDPVSALRSA